MAVMANFEIKRILVDQGSSEDILFLDLLKTLNILEEDLSPYERMDLSGFNFSKTKPLGYLDLMVTYGAEPQGKSRTLKIRFLVLPYKLVYNCIIGLIVGRKSKPPLKT